MADVRRAVTGGVTMPAGYFTTYGGQFENQERATRRLGLIVPFVLLLIAGLLDVLDPAGAADGVRVGRGAAAGARASRYFR